MNEILEKCLSYDKTNGCINTFNGQCNKERCQTYILLQENEKLKEEILTLKSAIDYQLNINEQINRKYIDIKNMINKPVFLPNIEEQATNKYKQALMEIREIAGSIIGDANATYTEFFEKLSNLLDKINSVIGAEE